MSNRAEENSETQARKRFLGPCLLVAPIMEPNSMRFLARTLRAGSVLSLLVASVVSHAQTSSPTGSPLSGGLLMARAIHSGNVKLHELPLSRTLTTAITCTPAPCVMKNAQASNGTQPVNDTPVAVNPANSSQVATGGNDYNCATLQGFYASGNGGASFHHKCLAIANSSYTGGGDPVVAYDHTNNLFVGGIDCLTASCASTVIVIAKSTNNGVSFAAPIVAVNPLFPGGLADKPWLAIDTNTGSPHLNTLYISTTQFDTNSNSSIAMSHSANGGTTWSPPVALDSLQTFPSVDQFSDIAIGKDGTVYVTWLRCTSNGSGCGDTSASMMFSKSSDGGNTWTAPSLITTVLLAPNFCGAFFGCLPNSFERVSNVPVIGVDNSTTHAGYLYVAMYSYHTITSQMLVQVVHSTNGGSIWSAPVAVAPSTATGDEFFPWLSVSSTGLVGVSWLDRRNDPSNLSYMTYAATSTPGGTSFSSNNFQIAAAASNPLNDGFGGNFMGDYTGNMWGGVKLYITWPDTRNGIVAVDEIGGYLK